jgi:uncharacterized zinc-type alcohol dehydrogenase-like protein
LNAHLNLLATDGTMVMLGLATEPMPVSTLPLLFGRRRLAGSLIGGIAQTQEMLDFCAGHGIAADIEMISPRASTRHTSGWAGATCATAS